MAGGRRGDLGVDTEEGELRDIEQENSRTLLHEIESGFLIHLQPKEGQGATGYRE